MNIVITGGAGFIGSNLALTIQEQYPHARIRIIDDFSVGNYNNLLDFKGEVITADLTKFDFNELGKVDVIFHQAAITDTTIMDQKRMMEVNVEVFRKIVNYCLTHKVKLIYASSAATYGHSVPPMIEGKNELPANIYGFSKKICDNITRQIIKNHPQFHIVGLKYFNVYGPREKYKGKMSSMIWQLYTQMKEGKSPGLFKHGEQKRDFVYVLDVVQANIHAMKGQSGIFNVGTGIARNFNTIIKELNTNLKTKHKTTYIDNPYPFYQAYTQADLSNANKWEYHPKYTLEKGIKEYVEWIQKNEK